MREGLNPHILAAFPIGEVTHLEPITDGLLHDTYRVSTSTGIYILQRLSPIIDPQVVADIEKITQHLVAKGMPTFTVVRTAEGAVCAEADAAHWRLITYIDGTTIRKDPTLVQIESAAELVARFHEALLDYPHQFSHQIPDFHDTEKILQKLESMLGTLTPTEQERAAPCADTIIKYYAALPHTLSALPLRVGHGDLKISNIRFDEAGTSAIALIDLDTVGRYPLPIEIGDMLRSWCKTETAEGVRFVPERWQAALKGYTPSFLSKEESASFEEGFIQITLELAARFLIDAKEQVVFAVDTTRDTSAFDQNVERARKALELYEDFNAKRALLSTSS